MAAKRKAPAAAPAAQRAPQVGRALLGGRLSGDGGPLFTGGPRFVSSPRDPWSDWRLGQLDEQTLSRVSPARLLELLADMSPEVSRAIWDWLRFLNPGHAVQALQPGTEDPHPEGQAVIDAFLDQLVALYGSVDVPLARLFLGAVLRGAFLGELVLDAAGRVGVDLATPDPSTVRFARVDDPVRGPTWQAGQWQGGRWVAFDRPTIRYLPVDPFPGSPYGRPMVAPAVFAALFLMGLLHDLRRVVAQQGYPRLDVSIDVQALVAMMDEADRTDQAKIDAWVTAAVKAVQDAYAQLQPEDAFVHASTIAINRPVGAVDSSSLGAIDGLVKGLERMLTRALKTEPLLMATTEGVSEANANRQWEVHAAGVKSLQHGAESLLEWFCGLLLRAAGIQADARWRFAELRASEEMRDQQTRRLRDFNDAFEEAMGWATHDEAALDAVGHEAAAPAVLQWPTGLGSASAGGSDLNANPEPGADRAPRNGRRAEVQPTVAPIETEPDALEGYVVDRHLAGRATDGAER